MLLLLLLLHLPLGTLQLLLHLLVGLTQVAHVAQQRAHLGG